MNTFVAILVFKTKHINPKHHDNTELDAPAERERERKTGRKSSLDITHKYIPRKCFV